MDKPSNIEEEKKKMVIETGDILYRWQRTSFSVYEVERVTPKCFFVRNIASSILPSFLYRLPKEELNVVSEGGGIEWATDPQILLDQIAKDEAKEAVSYKKFNQEVLNARSVLNDAL